MGNLPGQWDGQKWVCADQPADKMGRFYYCCPGGFQSMTPRQIQTVRMTSRVKLRQMKCNVEPGVQACGPKPEGDVKCCPRTHQWLASSGECPMPSARTGYDIPFLQRLRLPGKAEGSLGKKLAIVGIPLVLILIGLIYTISIN
jgi:hypothetical protein